MALHEVALADIQTAVGSKIELIHGNVHIKGTLVAVTDYELVIDEGLNPGYTIHLERSLIRGDVVKVISE